MTGLMYAIVIPPAASNEQRPGAVQAGAIILKLQVGFYAEITEQIHHPGDGDACYAGCFFEGCSG